MTRCKLGNQDIRLLMVLHISEFVEPKETVHIQQIGHNVSSVES